MDANRDPSEEARLDALQQLKLLDTPPSESFDRITRMASQIFGLPIAAVSLTDRDRQWFKSRVGVAHDSVPRNKAPCAEVSCTTQALVLRDLLTHPEYIDSHLAQGGVRFYAGAPLVTREGYGLGALCVLGTEPREASEEEMRALHDLAAMVMAQIELQHAYGRIDPVSGFPNRHQFIEDLEDLARDCPGERRIAVLVDLAQPGQVSDIVRVMGAARLDEMVREAAQALRAALGDDRQAYHVGSTQFAFLAPEGVELDRYFPLLQQEFKAIRATSSARFVTTVAVGIMPFQLGSIPASDVLRGAHSASQDARADDGGIKIHSPDSDLVHRRRLDLLQEFGEAVEGADQLSLVFQPRVDMADGRCVGAEALLRWQHPRLGNVPPSEFIPLIERTVMVRQITDWVMKTALRQAGEWGRENVRMPVSINISAANLGEADLVQRLQLYLLKYRVAPEMVELELTESAVMSDGTHMRACLQELADTGVRIAIDDFGTGYSSLAYLQRVPAHVVKIDQSFIRNLATDERDRALVATMIRLSHELGYRVVAEGIETPDIVEHLRAMGCEEAQGYLFGRPMEVASFDRWLQENHKPQGQAAAA